MPSDNELLSNEYEQRINRVIDYIVRNLDQELSLESLADIAFFSKFHFHRIFSALTGETTNEFVRRVRLEKSAYLLIFDRKKSITDIANDCGFSSSQNFAKAFKLYFGITPSVLRKTKDFRRFETLQNAIGDIEKSKMGNMGRNSGNGISSLAPYTKNSNVEQHRISLATQARNIAMNVDIQLVPDRTVAYIRHIGPMLPELISPTFMRLLMWAGPRELMHEQADILGVSWSYPDLTPESKSRYDACITVPDDFQPDSTVSVQQLRGGKCAVYQCEILGNNFQEAWIELMRDWLPTSGYQPDERPSYEVYHNQDGEGADTTWVIDFCLPVKPL